MNWNRALLVLVLGLLLLDVSWTAAVNNRAASIEGEVNAVERDQRLVASYLGVNDTLRDRTSATVPLYAYETGSRDATVVTATVTAVPANGLYVDVGDVAQTAAAQRSISRAWAVANASEYPPAHRGGVVSIDAPEGWDTVGGGSAALALALGFAATDPCVRYNKSVGVTGGLDSDGTVVDVSHVGPKVRAGKERGAEAFVVPSGDGASVSGVSVVDVRTFDAAADRALERDPDCDRSARLAP